MRHGHRVTDSSQRDTQTKMSSLLSTALFALFSNNVSVSLPGLNDRRNHQLQTSYIWEKCYAIWVVNLMAAFWSGTLWAVGLMALFVSTPAQCTEQDYHGELIHQLYSHQYVPINPKPKTSPSENNRNFL